MTEPDPGTVADRLELSVAASDAAIELAHDLVAQLWVAHPHVPASVQARFETALIEIVANIVEHAYAADANAGPVDPDLERRVLIVLAVTPQAVLGRLSDNGLPAQIDLSTVNMPDDDLESGRGLAMAIASLTDLSFSRDAGRNVWNLRCDLSPSG